MRLAIGLRALAVIAGLAAFQTAHAQSGIEEHEWVLLIDASGSFRGGTYDVRNEALIQLQTMLAIAAERNPAHPRLDRLRAYRFGWGVEPIALPNGSLTWDNVKLDPLWNAHMAPGFAGRTDFIAALKQAV